METMRHSGPGAQLLEGAAAHHALASLAIEDPLPSWQRGALEDTLCFRLAMPVRRAT
jgi:hypothetical protein